MLKVLHMAKMYTPDVGGIESVVLSLARGASCCGFSVTVICFSKLRKPITQLINNVKVIRKPIFFTLSSQPFSLSYFFACINEAKSHDIVHLHYPNLLAAFSVAFIPKRCRIIVHWHSDIVNKESLRWIVRPIEYLMLKRANIIVATSQPYANASDSLVNFVHKVKIIPIGVPDVRNFIVDESNESIRVFKDQISHKKIILSVGRLVPYKGFDVLIRAMQQVNNDAVLVIAGHGPKKAELQRLIDLLCLNERVLLLGRVDDEFLRFLFMNSTLFCLPSVSRAEAFGVVLLEAMTYKLPIIATNIDGSGVPWVNSHDVSGLNVPVLDQKALAHACNRILLSSQCYQKYSNGSRLRFENNFTENMFVKSVNDTYESLVRHG